MNVLFVGIGAGSFEMRGRQIGAALGARVLRQPAEADWRWADVAVLVKRAGLDHAREAHRYDVPIVWDVLDCWQQPEQNKLTVDEGKKFIAGLAAKIQPAVMIGATQQMATDIGGVYIPHHCRIGLTPTPPDDDVSIVAYDGQTKYLGAWLDVLLRECHKRGWHFLVNPIDLGNADLIVAFRDGKWDGPICRAWKSGVKIVNAIASGRPIIVQECAAAREFGVPDTAIIDGFDAVSDAFDRWTSLHDRTVQPTYSAGAFTVQTISDVFYGPLLERVVAGVSCTA